ncbi:hypothetical protein MMYC01_202577 [Madurella mycetomatis]|uniref:Uncharacterized protein n=1 Tax=Madurella mycetomatis TaxID=100816 RepID=A0A175W4J2_9PEZI|nr:hypothetical protein MMYC01_202577 [Madurella mycetomatis]
MPRPRPKRTRAVATRPAVASEPHQPSATPPVVTHPAVAQSKQPSSDIYDASDREKERIKRRAAEEAKADASQLRRTRASFHVDSNSAQARAPEDSRRRRNDVVERVDDLTSTSKPDHGESPDIVHSQRESGPSVQPRLTDASGLDLDDELFGNLDDSLDDTENAIEDTRSGYRSTDTSSFNVAMFKRRPRQSSVAGRDDAPIRPSSRGQNTPSISTTLNFGMFKRRAREPSILGTARRRQRSRSQTSQASRNASILGDGDDSGPDGESTPLDKTRRQTRASLAANASREGSPVHPSRKRKSLESHQDGREKRPALETDAAEADEVHQSIEVDSDPLSPPRGRTREWECPSTPVRENDPDMAPPLSSSSSEGDSPVAWPSLDTLAHRTYTRKPVPRTQQTPEPDDLSSDISSPPSLTHSPNYVPANTKVRVQKNAPPPQKKVTTADLASLLPRRRHKPSNRSSNSNDPFDLDGSDEDRYDGSAAGQDEDELSYIDSRAARRRKAAQQPLRKSGPNRKGKEGQGGNRRNRRTYGSHDKENEDIEEEIAINSENGAAEEGEQEGLPDEETSQLMRERLGEELQKAAKKFKEVDKWELSFEEVARSSSPPLAR